MRNGTRTRAHPTPRSRRPTRPDNGRPVELRAINGHPPCRRPPTEPNTSWVVAGATNRRQKRSQSKRSASVPGDGVELTPAELAQLRRPVKMVSSVELGRRPQATIEVPGGASQRSWDAGKEHLRRPCRQRPAWTRGPGTSSPGLTLTFNSPQPAAGALSGVSGYALLP